MQFASYQIGLICHCSPASLDMGLSNFKWFSGLSSGGRSRRTVVAVAAAAALAVTVILGGANVSSDRYRQQLDSNDLVSELKLHFINDAIPIS